jgi:ribonucleoside-diphosphate reductase alpha chain
MGPIESTNPCGEQSLYSYDSCNLGSINLANFVQGNSLKWDALKECVWDSIHFLDKLRKPR